MNCKSSLNPNVLAPQILSYSRRLITQQAPILLTAVYALKERERALPGPISTDGVFLWYHPEQILADFQKQRESVAQQILHVTLHCLLGHLSVRESYANRDLFDALADCKVTAFASALGCRLARGWEFAIPSQIECNPAALPALYALFEGRQRSRRDLIREVSRSSLRMDDHRLWKPQILVLNTTDGGIPCQNSSKEEAPDWNQIRDQLCEQAGASPVWGHLPGHFQNEFSLAPENGVSYSQFLRRFAAPRERLYSDPDSIDARWYHLGLEHYGDIPLLEPCELSEPLVGDDLVIAMDTSGSCSGAVCRRFLRETSNLLRDVSAGSSTFRVLLLQCDTKIQKELFIQSPNDLNHMAETFAPEGFGGTDFCPVFQRVEELRQEGALPQVKGLIYLSDGYGDFPEKQPDYPVAFILADEDDCPATDFPSWVTALRLNEHDFTVTEAS